MSWPGTGVSGEPDADGIAVLGWVALDMSLPPGGTAGADDIDGAALAPPASPAAPLGAAESGAESVGLGAGLRAEAIVEVSETGPGPIGGVLSTAWAAAWATRRGSSSMVATGF